MGGKKITKSLNLQKSIQETTIAITNILCMSFAVYQINRDNLSIGMFVTIQA